MVKNDFVVLDRDSARETCNCVVLSKDAAVLSEDADRTGRDSIRGKCDYVCSSKDSVRGKDDAVAHIWDPAGKKDDAAILSKDIYTGFAASAGRRVRNNRKYSR